MVSSLVTVLKENKIKITRERQAIIAVLEKTPLPLSPAQLYMGIKDWLPKANLTTVYRNLEMLEGLSLVKRLGFNKDHFVYELAGGNHHHHHAICKRCGLVEDLEFMKEKFNDEVNRQTKFQIEDHNLEFFGLCPQCQAERDLTPLRGVVNKETS